MGEIAGRAVRDAAAALFAMLAVIVPLAVVLAIAAYVIARGGLDGVGTSLFAFVVVMAGGIAGAIARAFGKGLVGAIEEAALGKRVIDTFVTKLRGKKSLPEMEAGVREAEREATGEGRGVRRWLSRGIVRFALKIGARVVLGAAGKQLASGVIDGGAWLASDTTIGETVDAMLAARARTLVLVGLAVAVAAALVALVPAIVAHTM